MFVYVMHSFVNVLLNTCHGWHCLCVRLCVCTCIQERGEKNLETEPNALKQCLFNHNLGLHENANQKQTGFPGKLDEEEEEKEK